MPGVAYEGGLIGVEDRHGRVVLGTIETFSALSPGEAWDLGLLLMGTAVRLEPSVRAADRPILRELVEGEGPRDSEDPFE